MVIDDVMTIIDLLSNQTQVGLKLLHGFPPTELRFKNSQVYKDFVIVYLKLLSLKGF